MARLLESAVFWAATDLFRITKREVKYETNIIPGYWKNGEWNGLTPLDASKSSSVKSLVFQ